jgi:GWxTD domain-containing protein
MRHTTLLAIIIALTLATAARAEPPTRYASWPHGPVKWLMTADDTRAWRAIKNDADARQFIALFWARRDPTPGTPENEYRDEFDHRVAVADVVFTRNGTRGALTDPGRVYIVLGPPAGSSLPRFGAGSTSSGQTRGGSLPQAIGVFRYENAGPLHLADPLIRFVSIVDGPYLLSPQGNSFGALDEAVHRAIVSPTLRAVPEWAALTPAWRRFQVTLVYASTSPEQHERLEIFPPGVTKGMNDVRALLPWKSYRFVDAITFSARSAEPATSSILAPSGKPYRVELRFTEAGASLNVSPFRVGRASGDEILSTTFAIEPGETVSVGTSRGGEAKEALLFFVTWIAD